MHNSRTFQGIDLKLLGKIDGNDEKGGVVSDRTTSGGVWVAVMAIKHMALVYKNVSVYHEL